VIRRGDGHISDADLIRFLDGQLRERESRRVRKHLEQCWGCRARSQEFEQTIAAFVAERAARNRDKSTRPPGNWRGFEARLHQLAEQSAVPPLRARIHRWVAPVCSGLAGRAAIATAVVALLVLWLIPNRSTVSAAVILQRAERARTVRLEDSPNPVAFQEIRVSERGKSVPAEDFVRIWRDVNSGAVECQGGGIVWRELNKALPGRSDNGTALLSAEDFAAWRSSLARRQEEVVRHRQAGGAEVLVIRTRIDAPPSYEGLLESELVVRAADWIPVSRSFRIRKRGAIQEFRLTEVRFDSLAREAVPPGVLTARVVPPRQIVPSFGEGAVRKPHPRPRRIPPATLPARLADLEVSAQYAVHRAELCLPGTVQVIRAGDTVRVEGIVDAKSQLDRLLGFLPKNDSLVVQVSSAAEVETELDLPAPDQPRRHLIQSQPSAIERRVAQQETGTTAPEVLSALQTLALSNDAVTESRSALMEAWAINRLTEAHPFSHGPELSPSAQRLLAMMLRDHVKMLRAHVRKMDLLVKPLLATQDGSPMPETAPSLEPPSGSSLEATLNQGDWSEISAEVVRSMERVDSLIQNLFTGAHLAESDPKSIVAELSRRLPELRRELDEVEDLALRDVMVAGNEPHQPDEVP